MTKFENTVKEFNSLVQQFKFIQAVDKFYDQNIISTDNNNEPTKGIENFRKAVENFIANSEIEKLELISTIVDKDLSVAHWHYIFTNKNFGRLDYKQISVQRWKDGKIVQENHFYNLF
ncbi:nuclear transport factor 2 family protein [Zobellia galactanivorans]|uniref:nuclear transport factor 2 family protein n=1 Tax=Zobellia galactanivorans (strain DSM 12802 / CCUG 47099 / CIP 106680 / NCIMB 13871 / Dsij) TaxID=63186 RepID=UPI001C079952|nr:nuclear transport factor 2 family protein [Zobellia galactanivorans]MBU3026374.1 nuclear transport factor 2 family protein [Zobellia galactanivorans]